MDLKKLKGAYHTQRYHAINLRNIDWQFTWETWLAWWGEDIIHRGNKKGQLVQARKGDIGPYSPNNCIKLTHEQNISDAQKGKTISAAAKIKMSAAKKGKPQKPRSAEHCANISAAKKGKTKASK